MNPGPAPAPAPAPAPLAPGAADDGSSFLVHTPHERLALLRTLRDGSVPVMLSAPGGVALPTTVWAIDVDSERLSFSADPDWPQLGSLVDSGEATAVAYLESVRLQFDLHGLLLVRGVGANTLQCGLPTQVYRFQRRHAYRVRPSGRLSAVARLRHPAVPDMQLELRVLDLSIGGCALWLPHDLPPLLPGTQLGSVQVLLDFETQFAAELTLQHISAQGSNEGSSDSHAEGVRVGCAWRPLQPASQRHLQRWIEQSQKRQRLLNRT